jgi:uncharacterized repeat protein (TIGR01451 family)
MKPLVNRPIVADSGFDVTVTRYIKAATARPRSSFRFTHCIAGLALSVAAVCGGIAQADAPAVTGEIEAFLVTQSGDGEKLVEATEAAPGEIMEFRIEFTNASEESVSGVQVVDSIPENTRFVGDSHAADVAAVFEVSVDGGESFESEPVIRIETQADGTQTEIVVPPSDYTHLRWIAEEALHADGGTQAFTYRVAVN